MNIKLNNLTIVITGSSSGIGKALAKEFVKEGANVVVTYFQSPDIDKLKDEFAVYSGNCIYQKVDVRNESDIQTLYKRSIDEFGKIDVLINNAGISYNHRINMISYQKWKNVIDTNLTGVFLCSKVFSKIMIKQQKGKILNIASYMGINGKIGMSAYAASKAGVISLTKVMAKELAPFGITVNSICPSTVSTKMNDRAYIQSENSLSLIDNEFALTDMINLAILLSSERIKGISGQNFCLGSREL